MSPPPGPHPRPVLLCCPLGLPPRPPWGKRGSPGPGRPLQARPFPASIPRSRSPAAAGSWALSPGQLHTSEQLSQGERKALKYSLGGGSSLFPGPGGFISALTSGPVLELSIGLQRKPKKKPRRISPALVALREGPSPARRGQRCHFCLCRTGPFVSAPAGSPPSPARLCASSPAVSHSSCPAEPEVSPCATLGPGSLPGPQPRPLGAVRGWPDARSSGSRQRCPFPGVPCAVGGAGCLPAPNQVKSRPFIFRGRKHSAASGASCL